MQGRATLIDHMARLRNARSEHTKVFRAEACGQCVRVDACGQCVRVDARVYPSARVPQKGAYEAPEVLEVL